MENNNVIIHESNKKINFDQDFVHELESISDIKKRELLLSYPTIYIYNFKSNNKYEVYIGESNNIINRTLQHTSKQNDENAWQSNIKSKETTLYVVGHGYFNKSLTLDIENRLIHYLSGVDSVSKILNSRGNPQQRYYPDHKFNEVFNNIWADLNSKDSNLFPNESSVVDSSIFKSSPLHKLTDDQHNIKNKIIERVFDSMKNNKQNQVIFIDGEAGTGKTVLNSSTFYELFHQASKEGYENFKTCMMVNHDEQLNIYNQIVTKLGLAKKPEEFVLKPTQFINKYSSDDIIDVAFIDEAHLLLTQGKQSYTGKNQLSDIIDRARVTIVMFDQYQMLKTEHYWEDKIINKYRDIAIKSSNYFTLKNQLRIKSSDEVIKWIDSFTKEHLIEKYPSNLEGYELKFFDSPEELENEIKIKAQNEKTKLSRILATYDWGYSEKQNPDDVHWNVEIDDWKRPWNNELVKKEVKTKISWAENPITINEVGSTFTIQGFDLNYAAVILGPSVQYRDGKIFYDVSKKSYGKMTQRRTLENGEKVSFAEFLMRNEVRVLLTRGVDGLYIYACDEELRNALKESKGGILNGS